MNRQAPPPLVSIDPSAQAYGSPDEAADAVSKGFVDPNNKDKGEQIAVIVKRPDGKFVQSTAVAPANHDNSALRIGLPKGHTLAGIVHSHPGADELGQTFSHSDINTAHQLKVPSFIRFAKDGSIRKYTPGKTNKFQYTGSTPSGGTEQLYAAHGDPIEVPPAPATADALTQPSPSGQSQDITVQAQRVSSQDTDAQDTDAPDDRGAQELPVIDKREATNRVRSGGYDAKGSPARPAMVDTQTRGDSSSAQSAAPADKWEARLRAMGPDLPPEDPQAAAAYNAKNPAPPSTRAPVQQPPLNKWEARLQSLGPDQPPPPAPPAPVPARSPSYLKSFGQGVKGVAEQGRQLLSLLGYTLMPWGAAASEGGDVQAQEDLSDDPTQQAQKDNYFRNVVDPAVRGIQETELPPDATFGEKLSHGLGATAAMIAEAIVTGGGSIEAATAETAAGRAAQRAASGAAAMSVPAAQNAVDTGRRVLEATGDKRAAVIAGVTSYATTAAQGAIPMGLGGKILTRMASGAGIGVAAGEANRVVSNASMPDSMQQPFDIQTDALNAITGSLFGALPGHESAPPRTLAERRGNVQETHDYLDHLQALEAARVKAQGGDNLSQVVAATGVNAEAGSYYHAGEYEGHIATRHAQIAEESAAQAVTDREEALNKAGEQNASTAPSPDDAFAARERQQSQAKDQDFIAARNQVADQTVQRATEEADTAQAGAEKGGATQPAPTIADAMSPDTLQALKSLQERRAAEATKSPAAATPAETVARIKAATPEGEDFQALPPNARGTEPAPTPASRLASIRQAAEKRAAQPPASLAARRAETGGTPEAAFDRLASARPREVSSLVAKLTPEEAADHLGRLDDSDVENAPLRSALQQRAQPTEKPQEASAAKTSQVPAANPIGQTAKASKAAKAESPESAQTAGMVSIAQRRAAAEAGAAEEGRWQALMRAKPEEAAQLTGEMAPEEAQKHLSRLDAAPGDNAVARKALKDRIVAGRGEVEEAVHEAATSPRNQLETPSTAQQNAGNFKMGKVDVQGLPISIEHPEGATRPSGQTPRGGHYGYVRGTVDADGMHSDVLLGKHPENENAFVVDHRDMAGDWQQHKILVGFQNKLSAMRAYRSLFPDNPLGPVSEVKVPELKKWLAEGDTTKPYDQKAVNRLGDNRVRLSTAEAKPTDPQAVAHESANAGDGRVAHTYRHQGGELRAIEDRTAGVTHVEHINVPQNVRGRGAGTAMIERAVQDAHNRNQRFESDNRVSAMQTGTYQSLRDRGYPVEERPHTVDRGTGEKVSKSELRGVYEVKPKTDSLADRRARNRQAPLDNRERDRMRTPPLSKAEGEEAIKPITDRFGGKNVSVHDGYDSAPAHVKSAILEAAGGNERTARDARGVYLPLKPDGTGDEVHIMAGNHTSAEDAARTAVHEIVGHKGLSHLFADDLDYAREMTNIYRGIKNREWVDDFMSQHGLDPKNLSHQQIAADEYAAHLAESDKEDPSMLRRIIDNVRGALRRLGVVRDWTDDDIRALLRKSRSGLEHESATAMEQVKAKGYGGRLARGPDDSYFAEDHPLSQAAKFGSTMEDQANYNPGFVRSRLDLLGGPIRDFLDAHIDDRLGALHLDNLKDLVSAKFMPDVRGFISDHYLMDGRRGRLMEEGATKLRNWANWASRNKNEHASLRGMMTANTLAGVDSAETFKPKYSDEAKAADSAKQAHEDIRQKYYDQAKKQFDALPAKAQDIYRDVRDFYKQKRLDTFKALEDRINATEASPQAKRQTMAALRKAFESGQVDEPYFPLPRFGTLWASAKDSAGAKEPLYARFETNRQKDKWLAGVKNEGYDDLDGGEYLDNKSVAESVNPDFVKKVMGVDGLSNEMKDEIWQAYLEQVPQQSMRKQMIHRQGRLGFSNDAMRAFAHTAFHNAHQQARLEYGAKLDQRISNIKAQAEALNTSAVKTGDKTLVNEAKWGSALAREMERRYNWIKNPSTNSIAGAITKYGFNWYLGFAPATAFRISTQNMMLAHPMLAGAFGGDGALGALRGQARATKALSKAVAQWAVAKGDLADKLRGDERAAFGAANDMGLFTNTFAQDLVTGGSGKPVYGGTSPLSQAQYWATRAAAFVFNAAEHKNRMSTFLAAYRLGREDGLSHEAAIEKARDLTQDAHFNYSNSARPRYLQNDAAKVIGLFRQYGWGVTYQLARKFSDSVSRNPLLTSEERTIARRTMGGLLVRSVMFAGVTGLPLAWAATMAVNAAMSTKNEKFDSVAAAHAWLKSHLGQHTADAVMTGPMGAMTGASLSSAASYSDLWYRGPGNYREMTYPELWLDALSQAAGAAPGIVKNAAEGAQMLSQGHIERGLEHFAPPEPAALMKAYRYSQEGVKNLTGETIIPRDNGEHPIMGTYGEPGMTPTTIGDKDLFLQAMGLTPQKIASQYAENSAIENATKARAQRKSQIEENAFMNFSMNDESRMEDSFKEIDQWNAEHPTDPIGKGLANSMRNKFMREAESVHGVNVPRGSQDLLQKYSPGAAP